MCEHLDCVLCVLTIEVHFLHLPPIRSNPSPSCALSINLRTFSALRLPSLNPTFSHFLHHIDSSTAGGPIGGQTRIKLRNEHASYIFTW
ncbi:unnamed protein product [Echinostoma caproni]|uniref:Secreted protein n=1 Tax=Echinostoma caproni TaxID=27848 RepID=A0A183AT93_9TREM|nr:unnamed protein product [Echinostoma caproni]